jgi:hypothetical protein
MQIFGSSSMLGLRVLLAVALATTGLTATRLSAQESAVPKPIRQAMSGLVGTWQVTGEADGTPWSGKYTCQWNAGKNCLVLDMEYLGLHSTGISGWNPSTRELTETWYRSDGVSVEHRFSQFEGGRWTGTVALIDAEGHRSEGVVELTWIDESTFKFQGKAGEAVLTTTHKRLP